MSKVYACQLWSDYTHTYEQVGETIDVEGQQMIRIGQGTNGTIVPVGSEWRSTRAEAKRAAAEKVDQARIKLAGLAAKLRAEADAEEGKEASA